MTAVFSPCRKYRYRLERRLLLGSRTMAVTMLNPSDANEVDNDPTIRKLLGFSERLGVGRLIVTNLAALISTDPKGLRQADDPIGPENDSHILAAVAEADFVVAAWGAGVVHLPMFAWRVETVVELLRRSRQPGLEHVSCWGRTLDHHPRHPLMLSYATKLEPFT